MGAASCTTCQAGKIAPGTGATSCVECTAGKFEEYGTICSECPTGKFARTGASPVRPTPSIALILWDLWPTQGTRRRATGSLWLATTQTSSVHQDPPCLAARAAVCAPQASSCRLHVETCTRCECNTFSTSNSSSCDLTCAAGTFGNTTSGACDPCPPEHFCINSRAVPFWGAHICPPGQAVLANASSATDRTQRMCTALDFYGQNVRECVPCPAGSVQPASGQTYCTRCDAGFFQSDNVCLRCPVGFFQNATGQTSCIECAQHAPQACAKTAVTRALVTAARAQQVHSPGVVPASKGHRLFQNATGRPSACSAPRAVAGVRKECGGTSAGYQLVRTGLLSTRALPRARTARRRLSPRRNAASCELCAAGFVQPEQGQTYCTKCDAGWFENDGICERCADDSFQKVAGQTECIQCSSLPCVVGVRKECGGTSAGYCSLCAPGSFINSSTATCEDCAAGKFGNGSNCEPCPSGRHQDSVVSRFVSPSSHACRASTTLTRRYRPSPAA